MRNQEFDSSDPDAFDIEIGGRLSHVSVHKIKAVKVFHLTFGKRGRRALKITVATRDDGNKFWTSVPEGRQDEAELAGKVIAAYIREYRRNQLCVTTTDKKSPAPNLFG